MCIKFFKFWISKTLGIFCSFFEQKNLVSYNRNDNKKYFEIFTSMRNTHKVWLSVVIHQMRKVEKYIAVLCIRIILVGCKF